MLKSPPTWQTPVAGRNRGGSTHRQRGADGSASPCTHEDAAPTSSSRSSPWKSGEASQTSSRVAVLEAVTEFTVIVEVVTCRLWLVAPAAQAIMSSVLSGTYRTRPVGRRGVEVLAAAGRLARRRGPKARRFRWTSLAATRTICSPTSPHAHWLGTFRRYLSKASAAAPGPRDVKRARRGLAAVVGALLGARLDLVEEIHLLSRSRLPGSRGSI